VNIWNRMTVSELVISTKRNIDNVMEAISLVDSVKNYNENSIIDDERILYNVVRVLGAKFKVIPKPESKVEKDKDCDVVKRYE